MSTKTSIKRIALVAVAALGLGVLSNVAANAAATDDTITPTVGITLGSTSVATTVTGVVGGQVAFKYNQKASTTAYLTVDSGTLISATGATAKSTVTNTNGSNLAGGATLDMAAGATLTTDYVTVVLSSAVAGTQVAKLTTIDGTTGQPTVVSKITVTWGAAPALSPTYSTAFIADGNVFATSALQLASTLNYPKAYNAGAIVGNIGVTFNSAPATAFNGQAITAVITSGPGLLNIAAGNAVGGAAAAARSVSLTAADMVANNQAAIGIAADGTGGTSTIDVYAGTTKWKTFTVTFYGTVATISVVSQNLAIAKASSTGATLGSSAANPAGTSVATTPAVTVVAKDAIGIVVPGLTVSAKSTDTAVIASGAVTESDGSAAGDGYAGPGYYNASVTSAAAGVSGSSTTVVFRTLLADGVTYVTSAPVTFKLGGSVATGSVSAAFDSSSYEPGAAAVLTVSIKDSSGNASFDQDLNLWGGLGSAPVFSKAVQGSTPSGAAATMFVGGKKDYKMYAPSLDGDFSVKGTLDSLTVLSGAVVTASATVSGTQSAAIDAANEATDAANAAAEAADAATAAAQDAQAAVAALATQVATLIAGIKAQITTLTNLVIKIQKKVRA